MYKTEINIRYRQHKPHLPYKYIGTLDSFIFYIVFLQKYVLEFILAFT